MTTKTLEDKQAKLAAAQAFIAVFGTGRVGPQHVQALVEAYGGDMDAVQLTESPFAIMAYFFALLARDANSPNA